jgi:hypothetical protein
MDKDPEYPGYIRTHPDRGWNRNFGWIDKDNDKTPCLVKTGNSIEDTTTGGRGRSIGIDYGCEMVLMSSANGTKYWVSMGYGGDGHRFLIWREDQKPKQLVGNWSVEYKPISLDNNANVDLVYIGGAENFIVPSNCNLNIFVSNNGGSTYEAYDRVSDQAHAFSSTGTSLVVKLVANGQPDKSPYNLGTKGGLIVIFGTLHDAAKHSNIKFKIPTKRLKGKKK